MDDIVEMLRTPTGCIPPTEWELKAAKEIERLRFALTPLAALEDYVDAKHRNSRPAVYGIDTKNMTKLTIGHIRSAASALREIT